MKNIRQWFRNTVLVLAGVMLLAACGNPVKSDLQAIAKVIHDTGYTPAKNQEYQQRLRQAKNEAEPKATKQALTLSPKDTAAMMEAQKLALEGQQQLLQGQNKFMVAAGREGIKLENK